MIGIGSVTISNVNDGSPGRNGVGIASSNVKYAVGASPTEPPAQYLLNESGNKITDENGNYLLDGHWNDSMPTVPDGWYLWSRTVITLDDGSESVSYSCSKNGITYQREKRQYYLSTSQTALTGGEWVYNPPKTIPSGYYMWGRIEYTMTDGTIRYSDAVYENTLSGVINKTDFIENQITQKVWETDIQSYISEYDNSAVSSIRDRVTDTVTDLSGIHTTIADITSTIGDSASGLIKKVNEIKNTAEGHTQTIQSIQGDLDLENTESKLSQVKQTADKISWLVEDGNTSSNFTLTSRVADLMADEIDLTGKVTFSWLNNETQNKINNAQNTATAANTALANIAAYDVIFSYAQTNSRVATPSSSQWQTNVPTHVDGMYIWQRTQKKDKNGEIYETKIVCITGEKGEPGSAGTPATVYELQVSHAAVVKSISNTYNPAAITLSATQKTGSGNASAYTGRFKVETTNDNSTWTVHSSSPLKDSSSFSFTIPTGSSYANMKAIRCSLYTAGETRLLDQQVVPVVFDGATGTPGQNGKDAYTVILSNESHTFEGGVASAQPSTIDINIYAYKGASRVAATVGDISNNPIGMTVTVTNNNTMSVGLTIEVTQNMMTPNGVVSIPISVDGKNFVKQFTYSIAFRGQQGETGAGVKSTQIYYGVSSSGTIPPGEALRDENGVILTSNGYPLTDGEWSTSPPGEIFQDENGTTLTSNGDVLTNCEWMTTAMPGVPEGFYLWTKTVIEYENGNTSVSYSASKNAVAIVSVEKWYYHAESKPTNNPLQNETGWSKAPQSYIIGYKYWTCEITTFTDNTQTVGAIVEDTHLTSVNERVMMAYKQSVKASDILAVWTEDALLEKLEIQGGYLKAHTIQTKHLATNAIMSENFDKNHKYFPTTGSYLDLENGNFFTPTFSVINVVPAGSGLTQGAFFKGNIDALSGSIGGWTILGDLLYSQDDISSSFSVSDLPSSTSMVLTAKGVTSAANIGGSNLNGSTTRHTWAFTVKDKFGVTTSGDLYASNANISGIISGRIGQVGGINITDKGVYTGTKATADAPDETGFLLSTAGGLYIGKWSNGHTAFQVNNNGALYASSVDISGTINATGGQIGDWKIDSSSTTVSGRLYYGTNSTPGADKFVLAPRGASSSVTIGGASTTNLIWMFTAGEGFGVTTSGALYANNAHISGEVTATSGTIGGCLINESGHLQVDTINVAKLNVNKLTFGESNESVTCLNDITSRVVGSSDVNIQLGTSGSGNDEKAFVFYGKSTGLTDTSAGFYLGSDGISIGENNVFQINASGTTGEIGKIGPWKITSTAIYKGSSTMGAANTSTQNNAYFGDNGLSISNKFKVDSGGNATVQGVISANTFNIYTTENNVDSSLTSLIKAEYVADTNNARIRIGQNGTYGTYITMCYANKTWTDGQALHDDYGKMKLSAKNGIYVVNDTSVVIDGDLSLTGSPSSGGDQWTITAPVVAATTQINAGVIDATGYGDNGRVIVKGNLFEDRGEVEAGDFYARFNYRIFYQKDSGHLNETVQCIQSINPSSLGTVSGSYNNWLRFGSIASSSYPWIAMPINIANGDVYVKTGGTLYNLTNTLANSGGGTSYTFTNGLSASGTTVSVNSSYFGSMAWKSSSSYIPNASLFMAKTSGIDRDITLSTSNTYLVVIGHDSTTATRGIYLIKYDSSAAAWKVYPVVNGSNLTIDVSSSGSTHKLIATSQSGSGNGYILTIK